MPVIKTQSLEGAALDWAVAQGQTQCDGLTYQELNGVMCGMADDEICIFFAGQKWLGATKARRALGQDQRNAIWYSPSNDSAQGFNIIHGEKISLSSPDAQVRRSGGNNPGWGPSGVWTASTGRAGKDGNRAISWHETEPLIAAMRCYAEHVHGESVEVPDLLMPAPTLATTKPA